MTGLVDDNITPAGTLSAEDIRLAKRLLRRWDVLEPRLRADRRLWNAAVRLLERYADDLRRRIDGARPDENVASEAA